jgi:hypothetical protein
MDFKQLLEPSELEYIEKCVLGIDRTPQHLSYKDALVYNHKEREHMINTELRKSKKIIFHNKEILKFISDNILPKINIPNSVLLLDETHYDLLKYEVGDFFGKHSDFQKNNAPYVSLYTLIIGLNNCSGGQTCVYKKDKKIILNGPTIRGGGAIFQATIPHESLPVKDKFKLALKFDVYVIDKKLFETNSYVKVKTKDNSVYYLPYEWIEIFPHSLFNTIKDLDSNINVNLTTTEFDIVYKYFLKKLPKSEMTKLLPLSDFFGLRELNSNILLPLEEIKNWNEFLKSTKKSFFVTDNYNFYNSVKDDKLIRLICIQTKIINDDNSEKTELIIYLENGLVWYNNNETIKFPTVRYNILEDYFKKIGKFGLDNKITINQKYYEPCCEWVYSILRNINKVQDNIIKAFTDFNGIGELKNYKITEEYVPYSEWCNSDYGATEYEIEYTKYKMNLLFGFYSSSSSSKN